MISNFEELSLHEADYMLRRHDAYRTQDIDCLNLLIELTSVAHESHGASFSHALSDSISNSIFDFDCSNIWYYLEWNAIAIVIII